MFNKTIAEGDSLKLGAALKNRKTGKDQNLSGYTTMFTAILRGGNTKIEQEGVPNATNTKHLISVPPSKTLVKGIYDIDIHTTNGSDAYTELGILEIKDRPSYVPPSP